MNSYQWATIWAMYFSSVQSLKEHAAWEKAHPTCDPRGVVKVSAAKADMMMEEMFERCGQFESLARLDARKEN